MNLLRKTFATGLMLGALAVFDATSVQAQTPPAFLGLEIQGISPSISKALGLENTKGVLVRDIAFTGAAARSGVQRGDIILQLAGKTAESVEQLVDIRAALEVGTSVEIVVLRQGKRITFTTKTEETPPEWLVIRNSFAALPSLGITLATVTPKVKERFNLAWGTKGVAVSLLDEKKAAGLDIALGDVIVQVNQNNVWKPDHVLSYIRAARQAKKETVLLLVKGAGGFRYVLLPVL